MKSRVQALQSIISADTKDEIFFFASSFHCHHNHTEAHYGWIWKRDEEIFLDLVLFSCFTGFYLSVSDCYIITALDFDWLDNNNTIHMSAFFIVVVNTMLSILASFLQNHESSSTSLQTQSRPC